MEGDAADTHCDHIAERRGKLSAGDLRGVGGYFVPALLAAVAADDARQRSRRHRGLFGRQSEVEHLQQNECDGIVGADEEALNEQRQMGTY